MSLTNAFVRSVDLPTPDWPTTQVCGLMSIKKSPRYDFPRLRKIGSFMLPFVPPAHRRDYRLPRKGTKFGVPARRGADSTHFTPRQRAAEGGNTTSRRNLWAS